MTNVWIRPCHAAKPVVVDICHYRDSSIEEMCRLGNNGDHFTLAQYRGELYYLWTYQDPPCCLGHYLKVVHQVEVDEIEALFEVCFEVLYRGNWYHCGMIGGVTKKPRDICVVVDDPKHLTGLGDRNSHYMWGDVVEMTYAQIEAVRLCMSDPIDPKILKP